MKSCIENILKDIVMYMYIGTEIQWTQSYPYLKDEVCFEDVVHAPQNWRVVLKASL